MDGVHGKEQRSKQAKSLVQEQSAKPQEKHADDSMQNDVEQVIGSRTEFTEEVVESEREHRQWSVRLVAPLL